MRRTRQGPRRQSRGTGATYRSARSRFRNLDCPPDEIPYGPLRKDVYYGDVVTPKQEYIFRCVSVNIGGFPLSYGDPTFENFCTSVRKYQPDIVLLQELGFHPGRVRYQQRWKTRIRDQFDPRQTKTITAHNTHDRTGNRKLWGGVAILATGETVHYARGTGADGQGLGRWCWSRYQAGTTITRFVTLYRPTDNKRGQVTVYAQHKEYFESQNDDRDPRQAFLDDFTTELDSWLALGDQVCVAGDLNEDVLSQRITSIFESRSMHHMIFSLHDSAQAPETCFRNTRRISVDGIWGTPNLIPIQAGYMEEHDFPGDHRALWFDISYDSVFGIDPPPIYIPRARRLQLSNSKSLKSYSKTFKQKVQEHRLLPKQFSLEAKVLAKGEMTPALAQLANRIDDVRTDMMLHAEKKCRKLRMGAVQFSEATQEPRNRINFWKIALQRKYGKPTSSRHWSRAKKKAKVAVRVVTLTIDAIHELLHQAFVDYKEAKKKDGDSRRTYLENLPSKDAARILRTEEQRRQGRVARKINGKLKGGMVYQLIGTNDDGH